MLRRESIERTLRIRESRRRLPRNNGASVGRQAATIEVQHSMNDQMVFDVTIPVHKAQNQVHSPINEKGESYGYRASRRPLAHPLAVQNSTDARWTRQHSWGVWSANKIHVPLSCPSPTHKPPSRNMPATAHFRLLSKCSFLITNSGRQTMTRSSTMLTAAIDKRKTGKLITL